MMGYVGLFAIGLAVIGIGLMLLWWRGDSSGPGEATTGRLRGVGVAGCIGLGSLVTLGAIIGASLAFWGEASEETPFFTDNGYDAITGVVSSPPARPDRSRQRDPSKQRSGPLPESRDQHRATTGSENHGRLGESDRAALTQSIQEMMDKLAAAVRRRDQSRVAELFDAGMLYDALLGRFGSQITDPKDRFDIEIDTDQAFSQGVITGQLWFGWESLKVEDLRETDSSTELIALVRHVSKEEADQKTLWWLTCRDGTWQAYDYEFVMEGQRYSDFLGLYMRDQPAMDESPEWLEALDRIQNAIGLISTGDHKQARRELQYASVADLPAAYEALRLQTLGTLALKQEDPETALSLIDRAIAKDPRRAGAQVARTETLIALGRHRQAYKQAEELLERFGEDSKVLMLAGNALDGLNRSDEAMEMYRRAVVDNPNDVLALATIAVRLPPEDKAFFADSYLSMHDPEMWYVWLAEWISSIGDDRALAALNDAYRSIRPMSPELVYYDATVDIWREHYERAGLSLEKQLRSLEASDLHTAVESLYLEAMLQAGRPIRAYRNASDRGAAFQTIGTVLMAWHDVDSLERLADLHERENPTDPYLKLIRGAAHWLQGDYGRAEAMYIEGYRAADNDEIRIEYVSAYAHNRSQEGRPLSAYGWQGHHDETFLKLTEILVTNGEGGKLTELLRLHREARPDAPIPWEWYEALAAYLTNGHDTAESLLVENRDAILASDQVLDTDYYYYLTLAQAKQGAFDRATSTANAWNIMSGDPIYLVFVEAMRGNPVAAMAYLEKCMASGLYDAWTFYANDDIAPFLLGPGYEAFREEYPEPAQLRQHRRLLEAEKARQATPTPPKAP